MQRFSGTRWAHGDVILTRQILKGQVWAVFPQYVVEDTGERLVTFIQTGSEMGFPETKDNLEVNPWKERGYTHWFGHGSLCLASEGEAWSISVFWEGEDRHFALWYIDLCAPFTRFNGGINTLDHELDLEVGPDGIVQEKDVELFEERVRQGRYSAEEAVQIRATFAQLRTRLRISGVPAEPSWATWQPPKSWGPLNLPEGWDEIPVLDVRN